MTAIPSGVPFGTVAAIRRYPVKSMAGAILDEADLHGTWMHGDPKRARVVVTDPDGLEHDVRDTISARHLTEVAVAPEWLQTVAPAAPDDNMVAVIHTSLEKRGLLQGEHLVDKWPAPIEWSGQMLVQHRSWSCPRLWSGCYATFRDGSAWLAKSLGVKLPSAE